MEKVNIIKLNETELKNVINNAIQEVIQKEKKLINENWAIDFITQLGDFVHNNAPTIYNKILSLDNQWSGPEGSFDFNDPVILQRANQAVGRIIALPTAIGGVIGGSTGIAQFVNKYKSQIENLKNVFMSKAIPKS